MLRYLYVSRALQKSIYTVILMEGFPSGGVTVPSLNNVMSMSVSNSNVQCPKRPSISHFSRIRELNSVDAKRQIAHRDALPDMLHQPTSQGSSVAQS